MTISFESDEDKEAVTRVLFLWLVGFCVLGVDAWLCMHAIFVCN